MKIEEVLNEARKKLIENNIEDAGIIARVLLQFVLKCDRNKFVLIQGNTIDEGIIEQYKQLINKIIEGIPLQYITNNQEFYSLDFYVDENVLIPQPDTEILVEEVLKIAKDNNAKQILDICTGSGCIGISLAKNLKNVKITLSDVSQRALEIAKKNARNNNVMENIEIIKSNMFENIKEKYDIIVSNPPYIETNTIETLSSQVKNEPYLALDGGKDGLKFYKILIEEAPKYLKDDGYLCMEIGYNQKDSIIKLLQGMNIFSKFQTNKDLCRK